MLVLILVSLNVMDLVSHCECVFIIIIIYNLLLAATVTF